jgi:hypothetical protein
MAPTPRQSSFEAPLATTNNNNNKNDDDNGALTRDKREI